MGRLSDPSINDEIKLDDPVDLKQFDNIGKNFGNEEKIVNVPIVNMHVCADHELTDEEAKGVLDFGQKTLNEGVNEGVNKDVKLLLSDRWV